MSGGCFGRKLDGMPAGCDALLGDLSTAGVAVSELGPVETSHSELPGRFGVTAIFVVTRLGFEKGALRFRRRGFVGGIAGLTQENRSEEQRLNPAKTPGWRPRISCCHHSGFIPILGAVRMEWKSFWLAL